jgi:hypothetical protein
MNEKILLPISARRVESGLRHGPSACAVLRRDREPHVAVGVERTP